MFFSFLFTPWALLLLPLLYYLPPYLSNAPLRKIPGPPLAAFSNLWLMYHCRRGHRFEAVDDAHKRYGKFVRIQPNQVSVADPAAIPVIYGHGTGFLKSEYYDAFVSITRGLFNTRDRAEHTRKRKTVSHTFSAKSIGQFEQYIHGNLKDLVAQWDSISDSATKGQGLAYAEIDSLNWFNYLAFDIIGDLAFGTPFGMLKAGADIAEVKMSPDSPPKYSPAVQVLNRRGEVSNTLGCLPWIKPYAAWLPDRFFANGLQACEDLAGIAVARVSARLAQEENGIKSDRVDLLARLMEGKDENGQKLGRQELTAEALTQLIAGSDTTSNTSCAFFYWALKTPGVIPKLQAELDTVAPKGGIPSYADVKDLPYIPENKLRVYNSLGRAISEVLRIHSTSSIGLPRLAPPGVEVEVCGKRFPPSTVLSVPAYTIHHSTEIWGPDANEFNPDRWEEGRITEQQKLAFIPFSYGPRACVGRNVAEMELYLIISTVVLNYEMELRQQTWETREGFLRKPMACRIGMRKRTRQE